MAFCGKCGMQVPDGDAFCRACGTPVAEQGTQSTAAPESPAVPQPSAPSPVPPSPGAPPAAKARRFPVWIVIVVAAVVLLVGAGGVAAVVMLRAGGGTGSVSSADPGALGFDAEPFDPSATSAPAGDTGFDESAAASEPVPAQPAPEATSALTSEVAIDTVGLMLNYMHQGRQSEAVGLADKNMLKDVSNDKSWFSPGPDVLISFEVQDATQSSDAFKVRVLEQWNSGPEKTTYDVVLENGTAKVDGIKWQSW
ncbi:MAG: hypothetical protein CVT67_10350 [Actinobacteria bacterium HGW-Actinobacteria-7]|nr:MAG: hypothetical protein CVT67_10350 [Actinobacteria bacterium HGW-Actinobacteria-7]